MWLLLSTGYALNAERTLLGNPAVAETLEQPVDRIAELRWHAAVDLVAELHERQLS
jgi:hypothetical protein